MYHSRKQVLQAWNNIRISKLTDVSFLVNYSFTKKETSEILVYFLTSIYWSKIISVSWSSKGFFFTVCSCCLFFHSLFHRSICDFLLLFSLISSPHHNRCALFLLTFMFYAALFYHHISVISLSPHSISSLSFPLHPSIYFSRPHPSGYPVPDILGFLMCVCGHLFVFGAVRRPLCVPDMLFQSTAETFTVEHNKGGLHEIYRAITPG